jgi:hypothetical protein
MSGRNGLEVEMAAKAKLKRKSYFVDERALSRAKKALGVRTEAEVIRLSVERVAEMEEFWPFMKKTGGHSGREAWRKPEMAVVIPDTNV